AEPEPGLASRLAFEVKALTVVGLRPALVRCAACGRALGDPCVFSNAAGGGVHAGCGHGHPVGAADLALVEALLYTRLDETAGRAAPAALAPVLAGFLEHQVGRALRARELLAEEGR
ncbi:MAG TPA: DNA repair protein RecO C-terminal domain-containing protein, partial [Myxococcota bacterium]|nr:DNA repair protein RecO C-terminal domain-containing protein [Myxococcota bacterium]